MANLKANNPDASLRLRTLPQAEKVREIDPNANAKVAVKNAALQNSSDGKGPVEGQNVVPAGRSNPTTTSSGS